MSPAPSSVVIGGSGGIGRAVRARLGDCVATYRTNAFEGGRQLDVTDAAAVDAFFAELGPVRTLVFAAGPRVPQRYVGQVSPDQWIDAMETEANGFFRVVRAALPGLREARGSIVAITTAALRRHSPGDILSAGPKATIEALVRGVAREEGRYGVRANCVALGVIDTGMFPKLVESGDLNDAWLTAARRNIPLGRFGTADEVAATVAYLADAQYVTGQTLAVDGGYST